jgi:hypothetical protein
MTISEILQQEGISEQQVLREHAVVSALYHISKFESECKSMQAKYGFDLKKAQKKHEEKYHEELSFEDDYIDWEFAVKSLEWWKNKLEEARNVL